MKELTHRRSDALEADGISKAPAWLWGMLLTAAVAGVMAATLSFMSVGEGRTAQRADVIRNRVSLLQEREQTIEYRIRSEETRTCLLDYMRGIAQYSAERIPLSEVPVPAVCKPQELTHLKAELATIRSEMERLKEGDTQ